MILEQNNFAFSSDIDMASLPENTKKEFENLAEVEVHDAQVNSEPTQKTLTIEPAFENSIKEDKDFQVDWKANLSFQHVNLLLIFFQFPDYETSANVLMISMLISSITIALIILTGMCSLLNNN